MKKISEDNNIIEKFVMEILLEKQRARRWKIFFRFAWLGFFILLFSYVRVDHSSLSSTPHDAAFESGSKDNFAAVIELTGVIDSEQDSANKLISALEAAYHDPHTKGIIIRANSPGGSPVQAGIAFDEIKRLKKNYPAIPIYTVVEDICASGCYYIASATDKIFADKASLVGSIGVRSDGFGFVESIKKLGIERRLYTAGKNKALNDPFLPTNPKQQQVIQNLLNDIHQQFIQAVKLGRGSRLKNDADLFSGVIYLGNHALDNGLIDGMGNLRTVAKDVIQAEGLKDFTLRERFIDRLTDYLDVNTDASLTQRLFKPLNVLLKWCWTVLYWPIVV